MTVYYNENNRHAAAWLCELIAAGLIPAGDVDDRSIRDVQPADLVGYSQHHFFAGIGGWAYAARLAGWPDERPIWTGSCPCQPFSVAGRRKGAADDRHLWPDFHRLIRACRPAVVMGEQVTGAAGRSWFDGVSTDLESDDYAARAVDIPACAVNAPHLRNRLYWIAVADAVRAGGREDTGCSPRDEARHWRAGRHGREQDGGNVPFRDDARGMGDANGPRELQCPGNAGDIRRWTGDSDDRDLGDAVRCGAPFGTGERRDDEAQLQTVAGADGSNGSFWGAAEWIRCFDDKSRRAKPGTSMLAHGFPGRVGAWRGLGNAIVAPLAAEVIRAFLETEIDSRESGQPIGRRARSAAGRSAGDLDVSSLNSPARRTCLETRAGSFFGAGTRP